MGDPAPARGDNFRIAHERRDTVWMSQNTNELPRPPAVERAVGDAMARGLHHLYPHRRGIPGLPEAILADLGLSNDTYACMLTHGATEGHYVLHRATLAAGDEVIGHDPSFMPIHAQVRLGGGHVREVQIYEEPWKMTAEGIAEAVTPKTRTILLIDPINPLGSAYTKDEVRAIAEVAKDHRLLLVHDVAYRDFAHNPALATSFYPEGTIVTYTFSKSFGLAGLRLGALVIPSALAPKVEPFQVSILSTNVLAQTAALAMLETKSEWLPPVLATTRENQAIIRGAVDAVDGAFLPVYPSQANHFVVDVSGTGVDPRHIEDALLHDHGVFVRGGAYVSPTYGERFIRVSFSVPTEGAKRFAAAFPKVMERLGS